MSENSRLIINGGHPLKGSLEASGAKNACLPIMAASILAHGVVELERVPNISDVRVMAQILREIGVKVEFDVPNNFMVLDSTEIVTTKTSEELVSRMNASFDTMGPLLARCGEGEVSMPGGCRLGDRRVDFHIDAFRKLGAEVVIEKGIVKARSNGLTGARIFFPWASVGATENVMMAATMAEGVTVMENCAREPEVTDLANFLVKMGASIEGIGTQTLRIQGVKEMRGTRHSVIPDRIEGCTYLMGAAITGGDVTINKFDAENSGYVLDLLQRIGQEVVVGDDYVRVIGKRPIKSLDDCTIVTAPYPGFPTDLHPQMVSLLALANGDSVLQESIFDRRFMYVMELVRLGADLVVSGPYVRIHGVERFQGAPVNASDIRAGSALVLAGLAAEGQTMVRHVKYIDRGYQNMEDKLVSLGADVKRVEWPLTEID